MQNIIEALKKAILAISKELKFPDTSYSQSTNATGDTQLGFDIKSDEIITRILGTCADIKALISEEKPDILELNKDAKFVVAYDPLDGSSLFDVNFAIGSIFAVYENSASAANLKAAIYSIYGSRTELVIAKRDEDAPKLYRLNANSEFTFIRELKMGEKGKILAPGATQKEWSPTHAKLIKSLFDEAYRLRYSGAMVSDLHQILCKGGGLFAYPATSKAPLGKLRAFFEVLPFALIVESAGGATTNGENTSLLECKFDKIHATTPCFFGSKYEISRLLEEYKK